MSIRLQLILFGVVGNLLVALIFIFSFNYRENVQEDSSSESLLTLYEAAWFQTYNGSFNSMFKWQPLIGSNASFWDPNGEVFQDEVVSNGNYVNPFLDTVSAGRIGDAQYILDLFFEEDFDLCQSQNVLHNFFRSKRCQHLCSNDPRKCSQEGKNQTK